MEGVRIVRAGVAGVNFEERFLREVAVAVGMFEREGSARIDTVIVVAGPRVLVAVGEEIIIAIVEVFRDWRGAVAVGEIPPALTDPAVFIASIVCDRHGDLFTGLIADAEARERRRRVQRRESEERDRAGGGYGDVLEHVWSSPVVCSYHTTRRSTANFTDAPRVTVRTRFLKETRLGDALEG